MAATVYIIRTNGVEADRLTVKTKAVARAEEISRVADERNEGDIIEVVTQKTGKVVFEYVAPSAPVAASEPLVTVSGDFQEADDAFLHIAQQEAEREADRLARGLCLGLCAVGTGCDHCDEQYGPEFSEGDRVEWDANNATWHGEFRYANGDVSWVKFDSAGMLQDVPTAELRKVEGVSVAGYSAKAYPSVLAIGNMGQEVFANSQETLNRWIGTGLFHQHTPAQLPTHRDFCENCAAQKKPSVEEFPNERAYRSGTENANDHVRDNGLLMYGTEWQKVFRSSYEMSMDIQAEERPMFTCYGENGAAVHMAPCSQASDNNGPCCSIDDDGTDANDSDRGFVETLVTKEYDLSVIVDEITGATVELGWVTLTIPAMFADSPEHVAAVYGAVHGSGTPRHGWGSIITVHSL